jgi:chromosome segregation ATPase
MKPPEYLLLIKEIAGTKVYDERRAASEKILNEDGIELLDVLY